MRQSLLLLSLFLSLNTFAQNEAYQKKTYTTRVGQTLPYRILYPKNYDPSQRDKYPMILVLHGSGERGSDNEAQLVHGSKLFLQDDIRTQFPAIVVFPQCPKESSWMTLKREGTNWAGRYPKQPNWPLDAVLGLTKQLRKTERIDKKRLYIMGLSMGGFGTVEAISRKPKVFAAAAPICGGGDTTLCHKYAKRIPLWLFHGDADKSVPVELSRQLVAKLQSLNADVQYTEYQGVGHNSWDNAFVDPGLIPWMMSKRKK
jgi:predicted peptidase